MLFLRKLVPGGSAHSFGIHVAKMAGMPTTVLKRAEKMLKQLEKGHAKDQQPLKAVENDLQLSFFNLDDPLLEELKEDILAIDVNNITPIEAIMKINELKKKLK